MEYLHKVRKFVRSERRRSRISAHLPPCLDVQEGDMVTIAECRPLSKTISFVVVESRRQE
jgi:small subunit ribosomal protein S17